MSFRFADVLGDSRRSPPMPPTLARTRCHARIDLAAEAAMEQQILRRIAGERELGKHDEIGCELGLRAARGRDHARGVALDVADEQIELG